MTIKGLVPLLMARFPEEDWANGQPPPRPKPPTKDEMFEKSLYRMTDGKLYLPSPHIIGAMEKAASRVSLKGKLTYKEVIAGGTFIFPEQIVHLNQDVTCDFRPAVNGSGKKVARIMVARGRLENWSATFKLSCFDNRAQEERLKDVLTIAGAYIGVGSYRPRYGRFEIIDWRKVKS